VTVDESISGMSRDNICQVVLSDVARLLIGHVPRKLATCLKEVIYNGGTVHAEPHVEPAPSSSSWPEQHEVGGCHYSTQLHNQTFAIIIYPDAQSV